MSSLTPSQRYAAAMQSQRIPHRISLNADHFSSESLPGKTTFTTKRLRKLKKILTPNEYRHYTSAFKGRTLNREGMPKLVGRGLYKKRQKNRKSKKRDNSKKSNGKRKSKKK